MRKIIFLFISLLPGLSAIAQQVEEAPKGIMNEHLKIYVVVAVLVIIFAGISVFLLSLESRLKKLEKERPKGH